MPNYYEVEHYFGRVFANAEFQKGIPNGTLFVHRDFGTVVFVRRYFPHQGNEIVALYHEGASWLNEGPAFNLWETGIEDFKAFGAFHGLDPKTTSVSWSHDGVLRPATRFEAHEFLRSHPNARGVSIDKQPLPKEARTGERWVTELGAVVEIGKVSGNECAFSKVSGFPVDGETLSHPASMKLYDNRSMRPVMMIIDDPVADDEEARRRAEFQRWWDAL